MNRLLFFIISTCLAASSFAQIYTIKPGEELQAVIKNRSSSINQGVFIKFSSAQSFFEKYVDLGPLPIKRYTACFRQQSCWMIPSIGQEIANLPAETQFMLMEQTPGNYIMAVPLIDTVVRSSLSGRPDNHLILVAETGDTLTQGQEFLGLYVITGTNPYQLIRTASEAIARQLGSFRLRVEKPVPWFADHFGWGTWNAFYEKVSADKLRAALTNFNQKHIPVPYVLLDAGWQKTNGLTLMSFGPDSVKFPNGLKPIIQELKTSFGVEKVMLWQTMWGYWQGLNGSAFADLSRPVSFLPPPRMNWMLKKDKPFTDQEATVGPDFYPGFLGQSMYIPKFVEYYNESFSYLRKQGVDAIKIDAITWVEANANKQGGRLKLMNELMTGLQSASALHFNNELLNCSACSNDFLFNALTSTVTRSSTDFFPDKPESHGLHVFTNAQTSFWMGDIVLPDWDMFQSGHISGAFHAAARAISGGPVYSSDAVGSENAEILLKLMTSKGVILRCQEPGKICRESLFIDPSKEHKPIKVFNKNLIGGVIGAFNCSYATDPKSPITVSASVSANDIESMSGDEFVFYSSVTKKISHGNRSTKLQTTLKQLEFELFTIMPVRNGFAPIGVVTKYNPGGMISDWKIISNNVLTVTLLEGGEFWGYSKKKPKRVTFDSASVNFKYDASTGLMSVNLPQKTDQELVIIF